MAFRFFKSKDSETPPDDSAAQQPEPTPSAPPTAVASPQASTVGKIVPRQGSIAAALKAAAGTSGNSSPSQSAVFKPRVSVVLKPTAIPSSAPVVIAVPSAAPSPDASAVPTLPPDAPVSIEIPTSDLIPLFPENAMLADLNPASLPPTIPIQTLDILPQLSKGRVQLVLKNLLSSFPPECLNPSFSGAEDIKVKIPLSLLIPRLPESLISLPSGQAKQQIDDSLGSPFSERKASTAAAAATPEAAPSVPTPPIAEQPAPPVPPSFPKPVVAQSFAPKPPVPQTPPPHATPPSQPPPRLNPADATKALTGSILLPTKPGSSAKLPSLKDPRASTPSPASGALPLPPIKLPAAPSAPAAIPSPAPAVAEAKPSTIGSKLHELLGLNSDQEIQIQEIADKIRNKFNYLGVLIATEDGLPLVGSMPSGYDTNGWSSIGGHLFKKFDSQESTTSFGRPHRYMLLLDRSWFTIWHGKGIYFIVAHSGDVINPEFDQQNAILVQEVAQFCQHQSSVK
jgi:hypothetical protein